jgi:4-hydroxybenzoate polyprenyltransferase
MALLTAMQTAEIAVPLRNPVLDRVPLVVDLDDSLLKTDSLIESIFVLARKKPLSLFLLPLWRLRGAAHFKHRLAAAAMPDLHLLPYRADLLGYLREQKALGRAVILATAADEKLAREIGRGVELFDEILASDGHTNLTGESKRDRLIAKFGMRGFDYIGNGVRDLPVWSAARRALLVSPSSRLERQVAALAPLEKVLREPRCRWIDYVHALRPHHWVKNGLIFLPLALVHRIFDLSLLGRAALAFVAFNLCASSLYLLNDLLDLPADRRHPHKKERRLASGKVRLAHALALMPLLLIGAFLIAAQLTIGFVGALILYAVLVIGYSLKLKDVVIVDVLVLAVGYALRVAAGALAVSIGISAWLLTFCVFLFFSLALIKRYAELVTTESAPGASHARGYLGIDQPILVAQGIASGYLAVVVLALYTNTEIAQRLHPGHDFFWGVCLALLYWVSYLWMMAGRGRIRDDPVMFALSDRGSLCTIAIIGLFALLAI